MKIILWLLFPVLLVACAKKETDDYQTDMGYEYFPVTVGQYRTYAVDSIIFNVSGSPDTVSSQIRETIVERLTDESGEKYRVLREWRQNPTENWQPNTVWWIVREKNRVLQTEENLTFIKLTFPVQLETSWDGNAFFDDRTKVKVGNEQVAFFKEWKYQVTEKGPVEVNGVQYDDVYTVQEAHFETSIERRQSTAKYAKGIGLLERSQQILDTQCITCTGSWADKAEKGVILSQVLIDHN